LMRITREKERGKPGEDEGREGEVGVGRVDREAEGGGG